MTAAKESPDRRGSAQCAHMRPRWKVRPSVSVFSFKRLEYFSQYTNDLRFAGFGKALDKSEKISS